MGEVHEWRPFSLGRMERYNKNDVVIMQRVYEKLLPWMSQHTNHNAFRLDLCCPNCESIRYQKRGHYYSQVGRYSGTSVKTVPPGSDPPSTKRKGHGLWRCKYGKVREPKTIMLDACFVNTLST